MAHRYAPIGDSGRWPNLRSPPLAKGCPTLSTTRARPRTALALLIGLIGLAAGLALPFAPVLAQRTELSWPAPGEPTVSSTAILVPYRPAELNATLPCPVLR
nr:hypothetical protein [Actinomycetota bacterium]